MIQLDPDMHALNLTSITGITAATMLIVEVAVKRGLKNVKYLNSVPVWVYAVIVSIVLSFIANRVIKTADGTSVLAGNTGKVIWAAVISALGASGFYTWFKNPEPVKTASTGLDMKGDVIVGAKSLPIIVLGISLSMIGGCACPEKAVLREGMDQGTATIRANEEKWANLLTVDPVTGKDHRDQLPSLTPAQNKANTETLRAYENLVKEDRARDGGTK